jgi:hypothetical protein
MTRSKRIFAGFSIVFALIMVYVVYDMSSRTTFPGHRPKKTEVPQRAPQDSIASDTTSR